MRDARLLRLCFASLMLSCVGLGQGAEGERLQRMQRSPHYANGHFVNPQPLRNDWWGAITGWVHASPDTSPARPLPTKTPTFEGTPPSGLRVTWFGHSTTLVEIDGHRVLTDPVWSASVGPTSWLGPSRWNPPLVALDALPRPDAVVISHDHYDHLDYGTVVAMSQWETRFIVPLGVGAHLVKWGVPEARISEVDWWDETVIGDLRIVCTPARHASGRTMVFDGDATLWAGYALIGPSHRVYYSGDTGLFPAMHEIGERFGPFDLTMIEVGQYHAAWPDWHIGPEQAVVAHQWVRGRLFLPVHWGLFALAYHSFAEPAERAIAAATQLQVPIVVPRPGQSFEPGDPPAVEHWWPKAPWVGGEVDPIISSQTELSPK